MSCDIKAVIYKTVKKAKVNKEITKMKEMDEEKQAKVESQLADGMTKPASDADIQDVLSKEGKVKALMKKLGTRMDDVKLLWNMLVDYKKGRYPSVPWKLIASIVFFFVYLVNPFDVIPDVFPVLGFTDDAAVLGLVLAAFTSDIDAYKTWLANNPSPDHISETKDI